MVKKMKNDLTLIQVANEYIKNNAKNINTIFRHKFHLMAPIGWINDPNGFCTFNDKYHLFYQYHPYSELWGPMHWGHAESSDLIVWNNLPVALAPDQYYDKFGVFSGCAIQIGDELRLFYTGVEDAEIRQNRTNEELHEYNAIQIQCAADSINGIDFIKRSENPIIDIDQLPPNIKPSDFRDPKVWKHLDKFYMVVGARTQSDQGEVLFFESVDSLSWKFLNNFKLSKEFGIVFECPDLFMLDGKHVLIFSPQLMKQQDMQYENVHSTLAFIGDFNYDTGDFSIESYQELDGGFDFYAPTTIEDFQNNRVAVAWMNMWERSFVLSDEKHSWNGSITLPRTLRINNGKIIQWPIQAIENYRKTDLKIENQYIDGIFKDLNIHGNVMDLEIEFEMLEANLFYINFFSGTNEELTLIFDKNKNKVILDRSKTHKLIKSLNKENDYTRTSSINCNKPISLRVVLDVSSIELFFNKGELVMTSLFFPETGNDEIYFESSGKLKIISLTKYLLDFK